MAALGIRKAALFGLVVALCASTGVAFGQGAPPPPPAPAPAPAPAPYRPVPTTQPAQPPQTAPAAQPPAQAPQTAPAPAQPARLGGNGESCRARADCQSGLMCVSGTCRWEGLGAVCEATADCKQPLVCTNQQCTDPNAPPPAAAPAYGQPAYQPAPQYTYSQGQPTPYVPPEAGPFDGTRFIAGIGFSGGPGWLWSFNDVRSSVGQFDLKVGGLFQRREIAIVYAPHFYFEGGGTGHTIRLETANYHQLSSNLYWPIRASIGGYFYNGGAMMTGLDFINIGFAVGPALVEFNLAKLRFISNFNGYYQVDILFGFSAAYGTPP